MSLMVSTAKDIVSEKRFCNAITVSTANVLLKKTIRKNTRIRGSYGKDK